LLGACLLVQDESALGLHRPAEEHRLLRQFVTVQRELDLLEQTLERDVGGTVDHQAQGSVLGVLAQVDHRAREVVVRHARHGDEELVREVDRIAGHATDSIPRDTSRHGRNPY
jgi:hypothetical protein